MQKDRVEIAGRARGDRSVWSWSLLNLEFRHLSIARENFDQTDLNCLDPKGSLTDSRASAKIQGGAPELPLPPPSLCSYQGPSGEWCCPHMWWIAAAANTWNFLPKLWLDVSGPSWPDKCKQLLLLSKLSPSIRGRAMCSFSPHHGSHSNCPHPLRLPPCPQLHFTSTVLTKAGFTKGMSISSWSYWSECCCMSTWAH